jgi:hypothetical protein
MASTATCYVTTAGGAVYNVSSGVIHLPRMGIWHADLVIDAPGIGTQAGQVTITLCGSLNFVGTFASNGTTQRGTLRAHINGGGGGFSRVLPPKGYRLTTFGGVLNDILSTAGETASSTIDPGILGIQLPFWARMQQTAGLALASLLQVTGSSWRMLPNGQLWLGVETYPAGTMSGVIQISFEPELNRYEFVSYSPTILPGQTFVSPTTGASNKVSAVVHYIQPDSLRSNLFYE